MHPPLTGPGHAAPVVVHEPPRPEQDQLGIPERRQGQVSGAARVARPALGDTQAPRHLPQHRHAHAVPCAGQARVPQASHLRAAPGILSPARRPQGGEGGAESGAGEGTQPNPETPEGRNDQSGKSRLELTAALERRPVSPYMAANTHQPPLPRGPGFQDAPAHGRTPPQPAREEAGQRHAAPIHAKTSPLTSLSAWPIAAPHVPGRPIKARLRGRRASEGRKRRGGAASHSPPCIPPRHVTGSRGVAVI